MDEQGREAFRSFVVARSSALLRTAYLLTGNRADAEDLLQVTLAKTYLAWDGIREREALDGYVRRIMVNTQTSVWRRRRPEALYDEVPDTPDRDQHGDSDLHDALIDSLPGASTDLLVVVPRPTTTQVAYGVDRSHEKPVADTPGADGVALVDRSRTPGDVLTLLTGNGGSGDVSFHGPVASLLCGAKECG